jgi:hypothetical protein
MPTPRLPSSCVLAIALALASCQAPPPGAVAPPDSEVARQGDSGVDGSPGDARGSATPDAQVRADASAPGSDAARDASATPADAAAPGGDAGGGVSGTVACATSGNPDATCTLPVHCCFTSYSAQHDGTCMSSACAWGTISCDGPEDCPGSQHCCAHVLQDAEYGITGYQLACQASACGDAPANEELCHTTSSPAGTCTSGSCVTAFGHDSDLPPALHICR